MSQSSRKPRSNGQARPGKALSAVVVLSFGPRSATRGLTKALARTCAALGVDLIDVPAVDPVTGRPGGARTRLAAAVSGCGDGPILYIHDDAAIDDLSLDRLVAAHLDGVAVAVPATNDIGTDHFHGTLPAASVARAELKKLAQRGDVRVSRIERVRPACFVTDKQTLGTLVDKRIHDPFTLVSDRGIGFGVVGGAFCAHDCMCGERLRSSAVDIDRPVLVASMIVKDEEKMIGDCLESLTGLVDRVEVVDTGSSDETVRIARDHGAKVTEVEWRDDFAWARNQAADLCRDALYTLWIDADERVVADDPSLVRDLLAINAGDVEAFDINLSNLSDGPGSEASSTVRLRRIVSSELLSFTGRLHEVTTRLGAPDEPFEATTLDAISLNHLGYVAEVIATKGKRERNIQLARAQYASDDSVKASVDLARMLMVGDQSDEAVALLRDAVDSVGVTRADWGAYLHGSLAHVLMNTGQVEEAATIARQAFEMLPTDDLAGAVFATTSIILGREAEFLKLLLETDTHGLREPVFRSPKNVRIIEEAVVVAKARLGNLQETWDEVQSWFEDGRDFSEGTWEAVAEVACRRAAGTELLDLTIGFAERKPETTGFMRAVSRLVAPEMTAILALGVLTAGEPAIDAVSTGLVSAIVLGRWDLFDDLVQFAEQLDSSVRTHLADKVEAMGQHQRAQQLRCAGQRQKTAAGHPGGHGG